MPRKSLLSEEEKRERARAYSRAWKKRNPEKVKASVQKWRDENPERMRRIRRLWQHANSARVKGYKAKYHAARRSGASQGEAFAVALSKNELYTRINMLIPRGIDSSIRDDIIMDAILEVLEGAEPNIKKLITKNYQNYASKSTVSLDAPVKGTEGLKRIDLIASDDFHF